MATKAKRSATLAPRYPERKWGPFHDGVGVAVWLNEVQTVDGPRYFRSLTINPRRYRDRKTGEWQDAPSLPSTDHPALILALEAGHAYCLSAPFPVSPRKRTTPTRPPPWRTASRRSDFFTALRHKTPRSARGVSPRRHDRLIGLRLAPRHCRWPACAPSVNA